MTWDWDKLKEQQERQSGGGIKPPHMDDFLKQLKGMKFPGGPLLVAAVVILIFIGYSVFFTIQSGSVGVVQRFGRFVRIAQPGPNFKLPFGIETVTKVQEDHVFTEQFGTSSDASDASANDMTEGTNVALMLTGDLDVAVVPWIVQYRINDPYDYLFDIHHPKAVLRDLSEACMRLVVGDRSLNDVISKRFAIASEAQNLLQKELDALHAGIWIKTIELKRTNVPGPVQPSFNEVNQAIQEKQEMIYNAKEAYNKAIPAARGEAQRTIKMADGYALARVNNAEGDAARFDAIYKEYKKAKDVTRKRMYLEAIRDVLPQIGKKFIIGADEKNLLPLLNLQTAAVVKGAAK